MQRALYVDGHHGTLSEQFQMLCSALQDITLLSYPSIEKEHMKILELHAGAMSIQECLQASWFQ